MITVKVKLVNGNVEIFKTESYVVSKVKDMHSAILDVKVYADRKRLIHRKRHFQWFYKKFLYRPEQTELKPANSEVEKK